MTITIVEETADRLAEYASVPIRFLVTHVFDAAAVEALARGDSPRASPVAVPYWKDYDANPGGDPASWPSQFPVSGWRILAAFVGDRRVGGTLVVVGDSRLDLARDASRSALLWDLRVAPDLRGQGIGSALLRAAETIAVAEGAFALRVETQQVNVAACRFYQRSGFTLEDVRHGAYVALPDEVLLLWRKTLPHASARRDS
jgi:ribosomal protein S18 acetylase RimI-like enzyme